MAERLRPKLPTKPDGTLFRVRPESPIGKPELIVINGESMYRTTYKGIWHNFSFVEKVSATPTKVVPGTHNSFVLEGNNGEMRNLFVGSLEAEHDGTNVEVRNTQISEAVVKRGALWVAGDAYVEDCVLKEKGNVAVVDGSKLQIGNLLIDGGTFVESDHARSENIGNIELTNRGRAELDTLTNTAYVAETGYLQVQNVHGEVIAEGKRKEGASEADPANFAKVAIDTIAKGAQVTLKSYTKAAIENGKVVVEGDHVMINNVVVLGPATFEITNGILKKVPHTEEDAFHDMLLKLDVRRRLDAHIISAYVRGYEKIARSLTKEYRGWYRSFDRIKSGTTRIPLHFGENAIGAIDIAKGRDSIQFSSLRKGHAYSLQSSSVVPSLDITRDIKINARAVSLIERARAAKGARIVAEHIGYGEAKFNGKITTDRGEWLIGRGGSKVIAGTVGSGEVNAFGAEAFFQAFRVEDLLIARGGVGHKAKVDTVYSGKFFTMVGNVDARVRALEPGSVIISRGDKNRIALGNWKLHRRLPEGYYRQTQKGLEAITDKDEIIQIERDFKDVERQTQERVLQRVFAASQVVSTPNDHSDSLIVSAQDEPTIELPIVQGWEQDQSLGSAEVEGNEGELEAELTQINGVLRKRLEHARDLFVDLHDKRAADPDVVLATELAKIDTTTFGRIHRLPSARAKESTNGARRTVEVGLADFAVSHHPVLVGEALAVQDDDSHGEPVLAPQAQQKTTVDNLAGFTGRPLVFDKQTGVPRVG